MAIETGIVLEERYEVTRALRSGGMGAVYLATDRRLANTPCAIKEILEHRLAGNDAAYLKARFEKEMSALATLEHPGIPRVRDYFQRDESFYIVMDYIDGQSLDFELAEAMQVTGRPLEPEVVAATALQILEILAYLHNLRPPIIHRDVKPSNLLRETRSGRIKLVDFGLAKEADKHSQTMVGTPGYCAIEQMSGKAGPRSDIYSLGVTMHQLLCGQTPRVLNLTPLREVMPDFRPELAAIVEKACAQNADDRYQDAENMLADLRRWLQGESARNGVVMPVARIAGTGPVVTNGQARELAPARMSYSEPTPSTQTLVQPSQTPAWVWGAGMVATLLIGVLGTRMMMLLPPTPRANAPVPVITPGAVVLPREPAVKSILVADAGATTGLRVGRALAPAPVARPPAPVEPPPVTAARPVAERVQLKLANDYPYPTARRKERQERPSAGMEPQPPQEPVASESSYPTQEDRQPAAGAGGGSFQPLDIWEFEKQFQAHFTLPKCDACPDQSLGKKAMRTADGSFYAQPRGFVYPGTPAQAMAAARQDASAIRDDTWFGGGEILKNGIRAMGGDLWVPMRVTNHDGSCHGGVLIKFKSSPSGTTGVLAIVLKSHRSEQDAVRRLPAFDRAFSL